MWYLVLLFQGITIVPEKYPTETACEASARDIQHLCIKSPDMGYFQSNIPGTPYVMTVPCSVPTGK